MNRFRRLLLTCTVALSGASFASANTVVSTAFAPGPGNTQTALTDFSYTLTLNKFDPTLGTLTGATLYFYGDIDTSSFTLTNTGGGAATFDYTVFALINRFAANTATAADKFGPENVYIFDTTGGSIAAPGSAITLGNTGGACPAGTPGPTCNSVSYNPAAAQNTDFYSPTGTGLGGVFGVTKAATVLANYTGAGTFAITGSTFSQTTVGGGGNNIAAAITTVGRFAAEIDYVYTPFSATPEPTTMVLFGSALVGLGFLRRRKA